MYSTLKDYIMENEFCIHIFEDRINIVNYMCIYEFDDNSIIIKYKNGIKFIQKLYQNKINLYKIKKISKDVIYIYIKKDDLERVLKLKTIYDVEVVGSTGFIKLEEQFKKNLILIISMLICVLTICGLSQIVFEVDIITNNKKLKENLSEELKKNGIYKYSLKKSYKEKNKIKKVILEKYRSNIEWLEIENVGTKCILKLEERIGNDKDNVKELRNIVAKKDAVILDVKASRGIIMKRKGESVKKGDIIISGNIYLNENIKGTVSSEGKVMGEVWYKTNVSFPLFYYEEKLNGNKSTRYSIKFFNKEFNLFKKKGKIEKNKIFESKIFSLYKNTIYEVEKIDNVYNYDEAIEKALELGRNNIKSKLNAEEYIIYEKCLKVSLNDSKIVLEVFYAVCEDITAYERIEQIG